MTQTNPAAGPDAPDAAHDTEAPHVIAEVLSAEDVAEAERIRAAMMTANPSITGARSAFGRPLPAYKAAEPMHQLRATQGARVVTPQEKALARVGFAPSADGASLTKVAAPRLTASQTALAKALIVDDAIKALVADLPQVARRMIAARSELSDLVAMLQDNAEREDM